MSFLSHKLQIITLPKVFNGDTLGILNEELRNVENNTQILFFKSYSDHVFCHGMDVFGLINSSKNDFKKNAYLFLKILMYIQKTKYITVSLVKGKASGGGVGFAAASDIVIATPSASFQLPEGLFGLIPGLILPALRSRLSDQNIKKMVFTADLYNAASALNLGLVDYVVDEENFDQNTHLILKKLLKCQPRSVIALKRSFESKKAYFSLLMNTRRSVKQLVDHFNNIDTQEKIKNLSYFMDENDE